MSILDVTYPSINDHKFQLISKQEEEIKELVDRLSKLFGNNSLNKIVWLKNVRIVYIDSNECEQELSDPAAVGGVAISLNRADISSMDMTAREYIDHQIRIALGVKAKQYISPYANFIVMPGTEFSYSVY